MALVKNHVAQDVEELEHFSTLDEAIEAFNSSDEESDKDYIIDVIASFHNGSEFLVEYLQHEDVDKNIATKIA